MALANRRLLAVATTLGLAFADGCGGSGPPPAASPNVAALPSLMRELKLKDPAARTRAAVAIGEMGPAAKEAVTALAEVLKDRDVGVRAAAAYSLGRIGPDAKSALPALQGLTRQAGPLREVAAKAVEEINP